MNVEKVRCFNLSDSNLCRRCGGCNRNLGRSRRPVIAEGISYPTVKKGLEEEMLPPRPLNSHPQTKVLKKI